MGVYNPASLRVKEKLPSTVDLNGVVTLILPVGVVFDAGNGAVLLEVQGNYPIAREAVQDGVNARIFTLADPAPYAQWVADSIGMYWNGQRLQTSLLSIGGTGNRTVTLDASVGITLGDYGYMESVGVRV